MGISLNSLLVPFNFAYVYQFFYSNVMRNKNLKKFVWHPDWDFPQWTKRQLSFQIKIKNKKGQPAEIMFFHMSIVGG